MSSERTAASAASPVREAFTVDEFAEAHRLSRATICNMWRDGSGPAKMRVRGRVLISREAAERWRRQVESAEAA